MKLKLLFLVLLVALGVQAQIPQAERDALIAFCNATGGDNWTNNTGWDTDPNSTSDVSTWYGVTTQEISGQKHVTRIELAENNVSGTLSDFTALTRLTHLLLAKNNVSGNFEASKFYIGIQNHRLKR